MITSVRVGPIVYDVSVVDELHLMDGDTKIRYMGLESKTEAYIKVCSGMKPAIEAVTLLHEILHAVYDNAGATEHSEETIDFIAHGIADIIRQNPLLLKYLQKSLV